MGCPFKYEIVLPALYLAHTVILFGEQESPTIQIFIEQSKYMRKGRRRKGDKLQGVALFFLRTVQNLIAAKQQKSVLAVPSQQTLLVFLVLACLPQQSLACVFPAPPQAPAPQAHMDTCFFAAP